MAAQELEELHAGLADLAVVARLLHELAVRIAHPAGPAVVARLVIGLLALGQRTLDLLHRRRRNRGGVKPRALLGQLILGELRDGRHGGMIADEGQQGPFFRADFEFRISNFEFPPTLPVDRYPHWSLLPAPGLAGGTCSLLRELCNWAGGSGGRVENPKSEIRNPKSKMGGRVGPAPCSLLPGGWAGGRCENPPRRPAYNLRTPPSFGARAVIQGGTSCNLELRCSWRSLCPPS